MMASPPPTGTPGRKSIADWLLPPADATTPSPVSTAPPAGVSPPPQPPPAASPSPSPSPVPSPSPEPSPEPEPQPQPQPQPQPARRRATTAAGAASPRRVTGRKSAAAAVPAATASAGDLQREVARMRELGDRHAQELVSKEAELELSRSQIQELEQRLAEERQTQQELESSLHMLQSLLDQTREQAAAGPSPAEVSALLAQRARTNSLIQEQAAAREHESRMRAEAARLGRTRRRPCNPRVAARRAAQARNARLRGAGFAKDPADGYAAQAALHRALRAERSSAGGVTAPPPPETSLVVALKCAAHLPRMDTFGLCDPYVEVTCGDVKHVSGVRKVTLSPVWNEVFEVPVAPAARRAEPGVTFTVFDWEAFGDSELVGAATLSFSAVSGDEQVLALRTPRGEAAGELTVIVAWGTLSEYRG